MENKQTSTLLLQYKNSTNATGTDEEVLQGLYNKYNTNFKGNVGYKEMDYNTFKASYTKPQEIDNFKQEQAEKILNGYNSYELEQINSKDKMGIFEYGVNSWKQSLRQDNVKDIVDKRERGIKLSQDEVNTLKDYTDFQANVMLRGVKVGGELLSTVGSSVVYGIRSIPGALVAGGLTATGTAIAPGVGSVAGAIGGAFAGAKVNTLLMPDVIEREGARRINDKTLTITDKGELYFKSIGEVEEKLEMDKARKGVENENFGETIIDATLGLIPFGKLLPKGVVSSTAFKWAKKANDFIKVPGTTASSFVNEHIEEIFTDYLNILRDVDDREYNEVLKDYQFGITSANILLTGGIMRGLSGVKSYTTNKLTSKLESKGVDKGIISEVNNLSELQKESLLKRAEEKETEQDIQAYNTYLSDVKNKLVESGQTQEQADISLKPLDIRINFLTSQYSDLSRIDLLKQKGFDLKQDITTENIKGQYDEATRMITLFQGADVSTFQHETMHWFRQVVGEFADSGSKQAQADLNILNKYVGAKNNNWNNPQKEKFARSYEQYLRNGKTPTEDLRTVFEKLSEWFKDIYKTSSDIKVNGKPISLTPEITQFYDNIFSQKLDIKDKTDLNQEDYQKTSNRVEFLSNKDVLTAEEQDEYDLLTEKLNDLDILRQEQLQNEIDKEKEILFQKGLSEDEVIKTIQDLFGDRIQALSNNRQTSQKTYDKNITLSIEQDKALNRVKNNISQGGKNLSSSVKDIIVNASSVVRKIAGDKAYYKLRKFESLSKLIPVDIGNKISPFVDKMREMKKDNIQDYYTLDLALKNRDINKIQEITSKYKISDKKTMLDAYNDVAELLNDTSNKAFDKGLITNFIENYFPRIVDKNRIDEFLSFLRNIDVEEFNRLDYDLKKLEKKNKSFTDEDRAKYINSILSGYNPLEDKNRTIALLNGEMNQFYLRSDEALLSYLSNMNKKLLKKEFFGKEDKEISKLRANLKAKSKKLSLLNERKSTVKDSISKLQKSLLSLQNKEEKLSTEDFSKYKDEFIRKNQDLENFNKELKKIDEDINENLSIKDEILTSIEEKGDSDLYDSIGSYVDEITNLSSANKQKLIDNIYYSINPANSSWIGSKLSNSSYILALNSLKNAFNQIPELANSLYQNGIKHTITAIFNKNIVNAKELGLDNIVFEDNSSIVDFVLSKTGLKAVDTFTTNTQINAELLKVKDLLNKKDVETKKELELIFEDNAEQVAKDLKNGVMNTDTKTYLLIKLSETKTIFMSDRPLQYLKNPSTRFMYALKIYTLKQFEMFKRDVVDTAFSKGQYKQALVNLVRMQAYLLLIGAPVDLLLGLGGYDDKDPEDKITDAMIDNILFFNIINRYTITKFKNSPKSAVVDYLMGIPLLGLTDDLYKDTQRIIDGDFEFAKSRSSKYIPLMKDIKALTKTLED